MSLLYWIRSAFKEIFVFLFLVIILGASLLGITLPTPPVVLNLHPLQASVFSTGISLYQPANYQYFYSFSPLDDYLIDHNGTRYTLLTFEQYEKKDYQATTTSSSKNLYWQSARSFFVPQLLEYHVTTPTATAHYLATQRNNKLVVEKTIANSAAWRTIGTSLKINDNDILFNESLVLLTPTLPTASLQPLITQLQLTPSAPATRAARVPISGSKVTLINPDLPAKISIEKKSNQQWYYDARYHLLEIEENLSATPTSTITVIVEPLHYEP